MDKLLLIKMPTFRPEYKRWKKYGYKNPKENKNLKEVLEKSSEGYCMYYYTRVRVERNLYAHLEHAIEKTNSEWLYECIPDIGLACPLCNESLKKIGERKRKLAQKFVEEFEAKAKCSVGKKRKQCAVPCKPLRNLQRQYSAQSEAEIILQPMGVRGEDNKNPLMMQYNVLKMEFQPANDYYTYSEREKRFIESHINRFKLNDAKYKTRELFDLIRDVIDNNGKISKKNNDNWVTMQFFRQIEILSDEERLKICETIYPGIYVRF
ncbi:MAG: hypothetical protein LUE92_01250 [Clostridiales bacterium]|nr:hypothetical protein [Clostridiales bacterium]